MAKLNVAWIKAALELAAQNKSKLLQFHYQTIIGESSQEIRHLLNNLCAADNVNYLEIGVQGGGTLLSAAAGNHKTKCVGIDNFVIKSSMRDVFDHHLNLHNVKDQSTEESNVNFIEDSFESVNYKKLPKFNIVHFDVTPVTKETYENFFEKVFPNLAQECLVVFTNTSLEDSALPLTQSLAKYQDHYKILHEEEKTVRTMGNTNGWFNGIRIILFKKTMFKPKKEA